MCKATNHATRPPMGNLHVVTRPFQRLYIDFLGPYPRSKKGHTHILIIVDQFSRFVMCKAIKQATSGAVIDQLHHIFLLFGIPESLLSDNGRQFTSKALSDFLTKCGVEHVFTPKYSSQANASERVNRTLLAAIRSYLGSSHQEWDSHLQEICCALNNAKHESTQFSPQFLVFGQHRITHGSHYKLLQELDSVDPRLLQLSSTHDKLTLVQEQVTSNLRKAYQTHASTYNLRSRPRSFSLGQKIYVRNFVQSSAIDRFNAKLSPKFIPGVISKKVGNVAYEVLDDDGRLLGVYHAKDIKT